MGAGGGADAGAVIGQIEGTVGLCLGEAEQALAGGLFRRHEGRAAGAHVGLAGAEMSDAAGAAAGPALVGDGQPGIDGGIEDELARRHVERFLDAVREAQGDPCRRGGGGKRCGLVSH